MILRSAAERTSTSKKTGPVAGNSLTDTRILIDEPSPKIELAGVLSDPMEAIEVMEGDLRLKPIVVLGECEGVSRTLSVSESLGTGGRIFVLMKCGTRDELDYGPSQLLLQTPARPMLNSTQLKLSQFSRTSWSGVLQFDQSTTIPFRPPFTPNTLPLDRWCSYAGPSLGSGEGAAMSIELQLAEGA